MFYNDRIGIDEKAWTEVLADRETTTDLDRRILGLMYESENHEMRASEVASRLSFSHHGPVNLQISRFSKRVVEKTGAQPPRRTDGKPRWWHVPFLGYERSGRFPWIMRPELATAFGEVSGGSPPEVAYPGEVSVHSPDPGLHEGAVQSVYVNRYERNRHARDMCIAHYGSKCTVCGFDFDERYGPIGKGRIHVHHLLPLSEIQEEYEVDPVEDLRPVCPNCHLIIHSKSEPFTIQEVRGLLKYDV